MKPVEEVIDVVGDFGPGPMKQEEGRFQPDNTFDMSFDVGAIQVDQPHLQLQDQSILMPPQPGKIQNYACNFSFYKFYVPPGLDDNDSQQAAEAMIQLGYYATQPTNQDESIDFDPNYDPSDFLIKKDSTAQPDQLSQEQPQYQEPYEYAQASSMPDVPITDEMQQQQNYYGAFAQESFNVNDFGFQQPQAISMSQDDYSQPQVQMQQPQLMNPSDGGGLADLEISDSDDDDDNNEEDNSAPQNPMETSKEDEDGDGLWF